MVQKEQVVETVSGNLTVCTHSKLTVCTHSKSDSLYSQHTPLLVISNGAIRICFNI